MTTNYQSAVKKKKPTLNYLKYVKDCYGEDSVRVDPVSLSQLHFSRSMMDFMFNEKSKGMKGGLLKEKTFKDSQVQELQQFFNSSYFYQYMLDVHGTVTECTNLSSLWFKEFYLELCKQVQFPINTSLPSILTEFALDSWAEHQQYLLYPLDLYNDAAFVTLRRLKSMVIFDEIEAELNLCFDQFSFKTSQRIYQHYRTMAATILMPFEHTAVDQGFSTDLYVNVLRCKHINILGRTINLSAVLGAMLTMYFRNSIDVAISRYEASDFTYVVVLLISN